MGSSKAQRQAGHPAIQFGTVGVINLNDLKSGLVQHLGSAWKTSWTDHQIVETDGIGRGLFTFWDIQNAVA